MAEIDPLDEWQESRVTVARFDGYLADTRKYGFTLVTLLLTANALITTGQNTAVDRPAASIVVMALLLALFMLDNYYWDLVRAAVQRATDLEKGAHAQLSSALTKAADRSHLTEVILAVYVVFVFVAVFIAVTGIWAAHPLAGWGYLLILVAAAIELVAMLVVYFVVQRPNLLPSIWKRIRRVLNMPPNSASPKNGEVSGI
jgi:hypothetical protein